MTKRVRLRVLEFHMVHHCNLTCAGCSHFSPTAPSWFASPEQFRAQVTEAAESLDPEFIHRLGGEPLLNPRLAELVAIAREAFAGTEIKVVTNGVLVPRAKPELFESLAQNEVHLAVSVYPNVPTDVPRITALCEEHGITLELWPQDTFLDFYDPEGKSDPAEARANCPMEGCMTVRDGRFYPCSVAAWADFDGRPFQPGDGVPLDASADEREAVVDGRHLTSHCRFCRVNPPRFPHHLRTAAELAKNR